ncbi:MAG: LPS-assembly protein LptD [Verrucomicrobiota bacterium]|nr:LPS-assembly protein LptD [Verrucomicrobiota bacterium]
MRQLPAIAILLFPVAAFPFLAPAQQGQGWVVEQLQDIEPGAPAGGVAYDLAAGTASGTNVFVQHGGATLSAASVTVNQQTGEAVADGHVRIEWGDQIWTGEHISYNFKTHQMRSEEFRTGKPPVFAQGRGLWGDLSNHVYSATNAFVTTDDIRHPAIFVQASRITIVPGKYLEAWHASVRVERMPVLYFPYYRRALGARANAFRIRPGYRSAYGPFLLGSYTWLLNDELDGKLHLDYREKRGVGAGPDLNLHLGRWGEGKLKYYYQRDEDSTRGTNGTPWTTGIPENRQRFYFAWQAAPWTNMEARALVNYQSDPLVVQDFFESDYGDNPQPNTLVELDRHWDNWSLDAETTPRINDFFDTVERLPDVKLTGFRQQVFGTPIYYESETSAGYYRKMFAQTNGPAPLAYSAGRADTFHQLLLPWTFFNWLNVTPRAGGRFTYYSSENGPGGTNSETYRKVFNTGVDFSFKASRLWPDATNSLFEVDGLRHVIEPTVSYVFVPNPSTAPPQLPQFDSELPSLMLLPIEFPDYNDIDSIDSRNVLRFGLRNALQTKRGGQLQDLLDWNLLLDWRLKPKSGQGTFNDLYSDLNFRPRAWLALESQLRYDINHGHLNMAFHQITFTPGDRWSWGIGHWYLRDEFLGQGDNAFTSTLFLRLTDNWGIRATHYFNAQDGRLQQQFYTLYRDFRSWTAALTFRVLDNGIGPKDYTVAFAFSIKAMPRYGVGEDALESYRLVGE